MHYDSINPLFSLHDGKTKKKSLKSSFVENWAANSIKKEHCHVRKEPVRQ